MNVDVASPVVAVEQAGSEILGGITKPSRCAQAQIEEERPDEAAVQIVNEMKAVFPRREIE